MSGGKLGDAAQLPQSQLTVVVISTTRPRSRPVVSLPAGGFHSRRAGPLGGGEDLAALPSWPGVATAANERTLRGPALGAGSHWMNCQKRGATRRSRAAESRKGLS